MRTRSEKFVLENRERWLLLRELSSRISRKGYVSLTEEELRTYPSLFRLTCKDLAEARTLKLSGDVLTYLNGIIAQSYTYLYTFPVIRARRLVRFFKRDLPQVFVKYWRYIVISASLFLLPLGISFYVVYQFPSYAEPIVGEEVLLMMAKSYATPVSGDRAWGQNAIASSFYIQHNISIAFFSFAAGILAGVGTVYFLVYNGIFLGSISGYIFASGYGRNFLYFVTAHSVFELCGLIIAGAAGLMIGYSIVKANRYRRRDWLKMQQGNILTLLTPSIFFLFTAALIEGFLSPSSAPYFLKAGVAVISGIIMFCYFGIYRRLSHASPGDRKGSLP